jgi:hypothetical protein
MDIRGRVHNGVVIFDDGLSLPEGTIVIVSCPISQASEPPKSYRVQLPLVRSDRPGSNHLTAERIAEILDDDDVSA